MTVLIAPGVPNVRKSKLIDALFPRERTIRIGSVSSGDHIPVIEDLSSKIKSIIMIKALLIASMRRWSPINSYRK